MECRQDKTDEECRQAGNWCDGHAVVALAFVTLVSHRNTIKTERERTTHRLRRLSTDVLREVYPHSARIAFVLTAHSPRITFDFH
jgi:hypothetical protein